METKTDKKKAFQLTEYLTEQFKGAVYAGYPERVALATEFLNCFNELNVAAPQKGFWKYAPLLNADNVTMKECDGDGTAPYTFDFTAAADGEEGEEFKNYEFAPARLFTAKGFLGKERPASVSDAIKKCQESDVVHILARILFSLCFCAHPFKGKKYFRVFEWTEEKKRAFFQEPLQHIFLLDGNDNRFLNGYQEEVWTLWCQSSETQKNLWNDLFAGKILTLKALSEGWKNAYSFDLSECRTPCGESVAAMIFNDEYVLLCSEIEIGNKAILCYKRKQVWVEKCKNCSLDISKRRIEFLSVPLKVVVEREHVRADGKKETVTVESELLVYDQKQIKLSDLTETKEDKTLFRVIASKKVNALGMVNLTDTVIGVTCGSQSRDFKKDGIIALLSGAVIEVGEGVTLIVPGEPAEVPKKKPIQEKKAEKEETPVTPPVSPAKEEAKPALPTGETKPAEKKPQPTAKPIPEGEVEKAPQPTEMPVPIEEQAKPAPLTKPAPIQEKANTPSTETPAPAEEKKEPLGRDFIETEDGTVYRLVKTYSTKGSTTNHRVENVKTGRSYALWTFDGRLANDLSFVENIRKMIPVINRHPEEYKNLFYAIDVIKPKGFGKGKFGYVTLALPNHRTHNLARLIKAGEEFSCKRKKIEAFLELFKTFDTLHTKGISYKEIVAEYVYYDTNNDRVLLICNHPLSPEGFAIKPRSSAFVPDEVLKEVCKADKISDCYALAVLLFMTLFNVPLESFDRERIVKRQGFLERTVTAIKESVFDEEEEGGMKWREVLPVAVADLFERTFAKGIPSKKYERMSAEEKREETARIVAERAERPTAEEWCRCLQEWLDDGVYREKK